MSEKTKIYTEGTPNPNALKFVLDKTISELETYNYQNKESAKNSPLAKKLFEINSVEEVFIGKNFITLSKMANIPWETIYDKAIEIITKHIDSGEEVVLNKENAKPKKEAGSEIEQKILEILNNQIRPAVASDGGDVIFDSYSDGILRLHLQGSCSSCPSSVMTLKSGIEAMLKRQIPELKEVISV